jgi:hypothetical protein
MHRQQQVEYMMRQQQQQEQAAAAAAASGAKVIEASSVCVYAVIYAAITPGFASIVTGNSFACSPQCMCSVGWYWLIMWTVLLVANQ